MSSQGDCKPCIVASAPLNVAAGVAGLVVDGVVRSVEYLDKVLADYNEEPRKSWRTYIESEIARNRVLTSTFVRTNVSRTLTGISSEQQSTSATEARIAHSLDSSQSLPDQQEFRKRLGDVQASLAEARRLVDELNNILGNQ